VLACNFNVVFEGRSHVTMHLVRLETTGVEGMQSFMNQVTIQGLMRQLRKYNKEE
jgi:hypothetical protein